MGQKKASEKTNRMLGLTILGMSLLCLVGSNGYADYDILWDTSHGVSFSYEPGGYYQPLVQGLAAQGFDVHTTSQGFPSENLAEYEVLVVNCGSAWNTAYTPDEVSVITNFVSSGGGLLIMAENTDCPNENIQPVASVFGVSLGLSYISPADTYTSDLAAHPIFEGVSQIYMRAAGEIAAGLLNELAWQEDTGKLLAAGGSYASGRVVVLGDSNPWSDCSGNYYQEADNELFAIKTFEYLAVPEPAACFLLGLGALLSRRKKISR